MELIQPRAATDEDAIRAVLHRETHSFIIRDLDAWAACWVQSPATSDIMVSREIGLVALRGWDNVYAHMREVMARDLGCGPKTSFQQNNMEFHITGDIAWVVFDGVSEMRAGQHETFETRILEKSDLGWRIVYSSFIHKRSPVARDQNVAVDADGRIVWISDEMRARLRTHPGLIISGGKLRARRPEWGPGLQDAFRRAAELHGFFEHFGHIYRHGDPFRCPVVLGEDDEGGIVTCVVDVRDGLTYVDIGAEEGLDRRLAMAAAIFGLSPAQTDIAREIVAGHSMTAAAGHLGITPATARTHLARIFEKTGVNSQAALVRILLSVG